MPDSDSRKTLPTHALRSASQSGVDTPILLVGRDENDVRRLEQRLLMFNIDTTAMHSAHTSDDIERWKTIYNGEIIEGDRGVDHRINMEIVRGLSSMLDMSQTVEQLQRTIRRYKHLERWAMRTNRVLFNIGGKTGVIERVKALENTAQDVKQIKADIRRIVWLVLSGVVGGLVALLFV